MKSVVFEAEAHPLARPQGGSLDLHVDSGQRALSLAEVELREIARYEDQSTRIYDPQGRLRFRDDGGVDRDRPEVDRTQLRQLLLNSLPESTVRWGGKIEALQAMADGVVEVATASGTQSFDLVVGADGAWSKVRPLVSDASPAYEGVTFAELNIDQIDSRRPELSDLVGHGTLFAPGEANCIIAQRNANGQIRVYAAMQVEEDWLPSLSPHKRRGAVHARFAAWAPNLAALLEQADDGLIVRPIFALPIGHRWMSRPGLTLIGDAAHLMSPFAGQGVNMAMADAADLALALTEEPDWSVALARYEQAMFVRAEQAARWSAEGLVRAMSLDGAVEMARAFQSWGP